MLATPLAVGGAASAIGIRLAFKTAYALRALASYVFQSQGQSLERALTTGNHRYSEVNRCLKIFFKHSSEEGSNKVPQALVVTDLGGGSLLLTKNGTFYLHMPSLQIFEMNLADMKKNRGLDPEKQQIMLPSYAHELYSQSKGLCDGDLWQYKAKKALRDLLYEALVHMILNDIRRVLLYARCMVESTNPKNDNEHKKMLNDLSSLLQSITKQAEVKQPSTSKIWGLFSSFVFRPSSEKKEQFSVINVLDCLKQLIGMAPKLVKVFDNYALSSGNANKLLFYLKKTESGNILDSGSKLGIDFDAALVSDVVGDDNEEGYMQPPLNFSLSMTSYAAKTVLNAEFFGDCQYVANMRYSIKSAEV